MSDEVIQLGDDFFKDLDIKETNLEDDIGLDLLSNSKQSKNNQANSDNEIIKEETNIKITGLDEFDNPPVVNLNTTADLPKPAPIPQPSSFGGFAQTTPAVTQNTQDELLREKHLLLAKLTSYEKRGIKVSRTFSPSDSIEEIRAEFNRIKSQREIESSIRFQRKVLMACVTGVEFLNNRFDPFDVDLDGWSESIHEGIDEYDDIFEEL